MDYTVQSMEFSRPESCSGQSIPSPGDLPNSGIKPRSPALRADSLPAEPQGKPKNTGVGSLSLLQGIFPTQGSNPGLAHCRRILYQLNYKESLRNEYTSVKMLFFLREEGKGIFKTKLRVAVINGGKQQAGMTKIHIQGAGSENVKLSHFQLSFLLHGYLFKESRDFRRGPVAKIQLSEGSLRSHPCQGTRSHMPQLRSNTAK